MRNLIALFALSLSLTMATAHANDAAPTKPAAEKPVAIASIKPNLRPAGATPAAAQKSEEDAEVDLSVRIAEKLAELRAKQALRAEEAARARRAADARRKKEAAAAAAAAVEAAKPKNGTHWTYEGEFGPENWSKINTAWAACNTGNRQSPIDLRDGIKVDLEQINFDYHPSSFNEIDNGHTIQVNVAGGNFLSVGGTTYELQQFHFHRPGEERINGKGTEMVVHLVHKSYDNKIAILAVLLERGDANPMIQTVWNNLPLEKHMTVTPSIVIDVNEILPARRDYFTYMGSLSEPPCTENVLWLVMKQPMTASPQQMALFSRLYPFNSRPVQQANGRMIKESM
ncbi:carbonic anhydrase [Massilia timonae]|uniref:carbonic anhydrase n=1 Tax=Massilia timonae TaxID=47229 RepID=A0A1S2NF44_9BURK|nr:carbonic anhydrase family protein [Massilia timonae]OIJ43721.1 eukaryotic-type carbonic anhydrase family protein [Massilia timonae]